MAAGLVVNVIARLAQDIGDALTDDAKAEITTVIERGLAKGLTTALAEVEDPTITQHIINAFEDVLSQPETALYVIALIAREPVASSDSLVPEVIALFDERGWDAGQLAESAGLTPDELVRPVLVQLGESLVSAASSSDSALTPMVLVSRSDAMSRQLDRLVGPEPSTSNWRFTIPPVLAESLSRLLDRSARGVDFLVYGLNAAETVADALDNIGRSETHWIATADPELRELIGELASTYENHGFAASVYRTLASDGLDPAANYTRAALSVYNAGDSDTAREHVADALELAQDGNRWFPELVRSTFDGDSEGVVAIESRIPTSSTVATIIGRGLVAHALAELGRIDDAIAQLQPFVDEDGRRSSVRLTLLELRLERAADISGDAQSREMEAIASEASAVRDARHEWGGPTQRAVAIACRAALNIPNPDWVMRLSLRPPDGEASEKEARYDPVVRSAVAAAQMRDRTDLVRSIAADTNDSYAESLAEEGLQPAEMWNRAFDAADSEARRWAAQFNLAILGEDVPDIDQLDPERAAVLENLRLAGRGSTEQAARGLRSLARSNALAAGALVHVHDLADATGRAIDTLRTAADDFGDSSMRAAVVWRLVEAGELQGAIDEGVSALSRSDIDSDAVTDIRRSIATAAFGLRGWAHAAQELQQLHDEDPERIEYRWGLAACRWNLRDFDAAWEVLRSSTPSPRDDQEFRILIVLRTRYDVSAETMRVVVSEAEIRMAQDDEENAALAINAVAHMRYSHPDVDFDESAIQAWQASVESFVSLYPDSTYLRAVDQESDQFLEEVRASLLLTSERLTPVAVAVRIGQLAYGTLAAVADRPLGVALIQKAAGLVPISTVDEIEFDREVSAAVEASGAQVVVSETVLFTLSTIPDRADEVLGRFHQPVIPAQCLDDLVLTEHQLAIPPDATMRIDPRTGQILYRELTFDATASYRAEAAWMLDRARQLQVQFAHTDPVLPDIENDPRFSFLSPLGLARSLGYPLYSGDPVIRVVAAQMGVSAFGTLALLTAMLDEGSISPSEIAAMHVSMFRAGRVDLPVTTEDVLATAQLESFQPGAASAYLSRPTSWGDVDQAIGLLVRLLAKAREHAPLAVAHYLGQAILGYAQTPPRGWVSWAVGRLIAITASNLALSATEFAQTIVLADEVCALLGVEGEPLDAAVRYLRDQIIEGEASGTSVVELLSELPDDQRAAAIQSVLT